jgi:hypothetical protein
MKILHVRMNSLIDRNHMLFSNKCTGTCCVSILYGKKKEIRERFFATNENTKTEFLSNPIESSFHSQTLTGVRSGDF